MMKCSHKKLLPVLLLYTCCPPCQSQDACLSPDCVRICTGTFALYATLLDECHRRARFEHRHYGCMRSLILQRRLQQLRGNIFGISTEGSF